MLENLEGPIPIADYDPRWPSQFERLRASILGALGESALTVEHVGSTAVPGLAAKPVIDVVLTVLDSAQEAVYEPVLSRLGFELQVREPAWFEHRMLTRSGPDTNLHVFSTGCPEITCMKLFRDWLRACPRDRDLYERTKRTLAQRHWRRVQDYADAKSNVVAEIMEHASSRHPGKGSP